MLFNSLQFVLFFLAVLGVYRTLPRSARGHFLLASSLLFYLLWIPAYILLLLLEIGVNYFLLRKMVAAKRPKPYLVASLVFSLSALAVFKYAAFFAESVSPLWSLVSSEELGVPEFLLPLAISFYTFQMIALTVDTYRGRIEAVDSLPRYALFVSFFPQLIAGPIMRGREFLPQLEAGGEMTRRRNQRGLSLLASGMVKKVLIADFLLAPFVDSIFENVGVAAAPAHLIALYGFAFQIYFDFSGYTDMARGLALLLGFEIPANFREPYLARNPVEFWRRWHITLSSWLRDYLYIPLGGNRAGLPKTYRNLLLTMLLGGLWHGAGWNFIIWGGLHGLYLVLHRLTTSERREEGESVRWSDLPRILICFHAVLLAWVFFRAEGFGDALAYLGVLFAGDYGQPWPGLATLVVLLCAILHLLERKIRLAMPALRVYFDDWSGAMLGGLIFGVILALALAVSGAGGEFIYFQF
ncbi:MAG: MBOAT family O-acyltransferase [Planctomycetota bacterium]|jgi:D-alanyl-lipoteichoic acid acyltransferase DltB (MBOAT superfamily)